MSTLARLTVILLGMMLTSCATQIGAQEEATDLYDYLRTMSIERQEYRSPFGPYTTLIVKHQPKVWVRTCVSSVTSHIAPAQEPRTWWTMVFVDVPLRGMFAFRGIGPFRDQNGNPYDIPNLIVATRASLVSASEVREQFDSILAWSTSGRTGCQEFRFRVADIQLEPMPGSREIPRAVVVIVDEFTAP